VAAQHTARVWRDWAVEARSWLPDSRAGVCVGCGRCPHDVALHDESPGLDDEVSHFGVSFRRECERAFAPPFEAVGREDYVEDGERSKKRASQD